MVGGQAFTAYPDGLADVEAAFAQRSVLSTREIRTTVFGDRVQEAGASIVSLDALYADPIGALRRARGDASLTRRQPTKKPPANLCRKLLRM